MKAKDLMTKPVYSVRAGETLNDAAQLMWEHDCGCIPVLDNEEKVIGMVTDRDIALAAYFNGKRLPEIPVTIVQSKLLIDCRPNDDIEAIEAMMQSYQVRRIPVIDRKVGLVGIISLNDIALTCNAGSKDLSAVGLSKTLAAICSHKQALEQITAVA